MSRYRKQRGHWTILGSYSLLFGVVGVEGGTLDELFILVRSRSPCASMANMLFAAYRQILLYIVGVAVWVAVQTR